jgi:hypothetical protein
MAAQAHALAGKSGRRERDGSRRMIRREPLFSLGCTLSVSVVECEAGNSKGGTNHGGCGQ